jgi:hypothetical protein
MYGGHSEGLREDRHDGSAFGERLVAGHVDGCRCGGSWCSCQVITYVCVVTLLLEHLTSRRMNTIFENPSLKNLKMYITNVYAKTHETLWEK